MGLIDRLKSLFGGGSKQNKSKSKRKVVVKSNRIPTPIIKTGQYSKRNLVNALMGKDEEQPRMKSMADAVKNTSGTKTKASSLLKADGKEKANASREGARERLDEIKKAKQEREAWHKATNHRYDVDEKGISDKEKQKRRQNIKSRAFNADTAVAEAKHAMKYHKKSESFARGALSGATFGASDLVAKKGLKGEAKKAEEVYQKNKSKGYELAGELAGSLAGFGLTANATEKAGAKVARKVAPKAAAKLSSSKVAKAIGTDVAQNLTTGAIYDVNKASAEHEVGSKEWWKEIGKSAALNAAVTGAVGVGSVVKSGRQAAKGAKEAAERLAKADVADEVRVGLNRKRKTDVRLPNERERWYHAGDLGKAEWYGNQAGSRRGTGHFGTGTYLAGSEDILKGGNYGERPLWSVDASKYNTFRPKDRTQGLRVHDNLKRLNRESGDIDSLVKRARINDSDLPKLANAYENATTTKDLEQIAEQIYSKKDLDAVREAAEERMRYWHENNVNPDYADTFDIDEELDAALADVDLADLFVKNDGSNIDKILDEAAKRSAEKRASAVEVPPATYEQAYKAELEDAIGKTLGDLSEYGNETRNALRELGEDLGATPEQIEDALSRTQEIINAYDRNQTFLKEDSASTIFMKALGYEGVDVRGIDGLDDTEFGSVIYDLRPEDARLIREGTPRQTNAEELAELERRAIASGDIEAKPKPPRRERVEDFASVDEDVSGMGFNAANEADSELERNARRVMRDEPIGNEAAATRKTASETGEAATREISEGQRQAREAYFKKTGQRIEDGKPATDDQILDGLGKYMRSQGESSERKLSRVAYSQLPLGDEETAERFLNMLETDNDIMQYDVVHHADMYKEVANDLSEDWERWVNKICDIAEGGDWSGQEQTKLLFMSQYLSEITDATKSPEQAALAEMAWKSTQKLATTSAQTLNGRRTYAHLSKPSKMNCALDDMASILDSAIGFNRQHRKALAGKNRYERDAYIKGELLKDEKLRDCIKKLANAKTEDDISEAYTEMFLQFNKSNPKSGLDVLQELRYLNMLGNPKTHIRNVFGSGFFSPMRQISNAIRSAIEEPIAKSVGVETARHGGLSLSAAIEARAKDATSEAGKAAFDSFGRVRKQLLGSAKYETPTMTGRGKTAAGKLLDKVADFNTRLLTKEDDHFKEIAFKENYIKSYNRYLKDGKPITPKIKKQIEQEAFNEAQIATFNEYNGFAKWLNNIEKNATDAKATPLQRAGGIAVNAVMPFTKVPANIMKQSINYSPLGIARGLSGVKNAARTGDSIALNTAIDQLASGMTGTGIFGLGMLLGKTTDMFTTNAGKNDPAAKFKKQQGVQNYSVTFKDPISGETHSYTLDWLVPASSVFFAGIELANQMKSGDFNPLDFGGDWAEITSRLAEPVMETSMLSGLHSMLETMRGGYGDDDTKGAISILLRETTQSYINSFVPTMLGQAARTAYKTDMQLPQGDDWEYFRNQLKSKTGLANSNILGEPLGADTDAYGNVKGDKGKALLDAISEGDTKALGNYGKSAIKNFLSPANIQKVDLSELDQEKLRIYEDAVKNGADPTEMDYLFPKKQYKKQFDVADEKVQMSNRDVSTYNQAKTKGGAEGMRYVLEGIMFNRYGEDSKGKKTVLRDGYTKEQKAKLIKQFDGKSIREVEEWLWKQPQFRSASEAEQRKVIKGLWTLTNQGKSNAAKRVGEQAVYKAQGKDVNEYNFKNEVSEKKRNNLQSYIDAGLITYADAVDFAREAGKTYYYEDDEGGHSQTYFNKAQMMEYLDSKGYTDEQKAALFNSFKASNAKEYGSSSRRGRRGYGRRGYRRGGGGGGGSRSGKLKGAKSMAASLNKGVAKQTKVKLEPPMLKVEQAKLKKYKV